MDYFLRFYQQTSRFARWGRALFPDCGRCSYRDLHGIHPLIAIVLAFLISTSSAFAVELHSDTAVATAGYYQLTWDADTDQKTPIFQIEEATNPTFSDATVLYQGPDEATVVTGRDNGHYYYRARVVGAQGKDGQWSATTDVIVKHHSLARAFSFFAVGAFVFIAIFVAVVAGNRRHRGKE